MKILCIGNSEVSHRHIQATLKNEGHVVDVAADGIEGLKRLVETKYDLLILDLRLACLPGFDLLEEIRFQSEISPFSIVLLTGDNEEESRRKYLAMDASLFFSKPFRVHELVETLGSAVNRRSFQASSFASGRGCT